jgi:predicted XRE-type DNA-binding protein
MANKKTDLEQWLDTQYAKDSEMRGRVERILVQMDLEDQLVALREARGVSQAAVAKMLGVSQPRIAQLEGAKAKNVELRTLASYVAALGGSLKIEIKPRRAAKVVALRA